MRFRAKFQWIQIALAIVWVGLSCAWIHKSSAGPALRGGYLLIGVLWLCIGILQIAGYFWIWWEIGEDGLTQRRFWSVREVPWGEITRVGPWRPVKRPFPAWIAVDYVRTGPMSDHGSLHLQPAERDALIGALRAHASQAEFDL